MDKLSIVVPCYNEESTIEIYYNEMKKEVFDKLKNYEFEIIFVNDGSTDKTLEILRNLSKEDNKVRYISFSKNFGKEAAMYAGFKETTGDYIGIMDVDLQDPPELIPQMLKIIKQEGYDSVVTRRSNRKGEKKITSIFSNVFYKILRKITKMNFVDGERDFRIITRQMLNSVLELCEYNRFSKGIFSYVGYDVKYLSYSNVKRSAGKTKFSFFKLVKYALEGITSFSTMPLLLSSFIGILFCLIAFVMIIVIIVKTLALGDPTGGWPSLACIIFFVTGIQLFCIGIIGEYLAKSYLETKKRPIYIVKETEKDLKQI